LQLAVQVVFYSFYNYQINEHYCTKAVRESILIGYILERKYNVYFLLPYADHTKEEADKVHLKPEAKSKSARPKSLEILPSEHNTQLSHATLTYTSSITSENVTPNRLKDILQNDPDSTAITNPRSPVKTKLKKSVSLSSPRIMRTSNVKNSDSSHGFETDSGESIVQLSKVSKSSSSPELSSPTLSKGKK